AEVYNYLREKSAAHRRESPENLWGKRISRRFRPDSTWEETIRTQTSCMDFCDVFNMCHLSPNNDSEGPRRAPGRRHRAEGEITARRFPTRKKVQLFESVSFE